MIAFDHFDLHSTDLGLILITADPLYNPLYKSPLVSAARPIGSTSGRFNSIISDRSAGELVHQIARKFKIDERKLQKQIKGL